MSFSDIVKGAVDNHKSVGKKLIYASDRKLTIKVKKYPSSVTGAPMLSDLDVTESSETFGPFSCLWTDADAARANEFSREAEIIRRYPTATAVIKVWLEDVLVDDTDVYGQTYFDKALEVISDTHSYEVLGYDRYGLGTSKPYLLSVALAGGYAN